MMITRTISLALLCAYARALSPIAPLHGVGDNSDCALYLNGPGRTSAYDYSINLLKGNFGYEGQPNCITYEAVNQAYLEARNRILVAQPKGDWKAEDFASVGELVLDISINLARRYGLTYEEIEKGLPLIDTSRTLIREVCPPVFSHVECRAGKYRRLDGLCNNLQHPTWGATMSPFQRLIGPLFADGINAPRIAHHGRDLPLSRVVSRTMHPDEGFHDHAGTVMVIAWGQFMDHDYTLTATPLDPINRNDPEECCKRPPHLKHPYCNEIRIPDDDYFYRLFGVKCIDFVRGFPSPRPGCRLGSRVPYNTLTGVIDGNTVYGVTEKFARKLRTGFGGLLRMNPVFKEYGLKDLLPLKLDIPDEGCTRPNKNMYCFEAGEIRVNEQLVLTVMHTLMAREHNRVANALAEVNPHWDDETLFQEARRINIAEIQHITYNEFLPILLGKDVMEKFGLVLEKEGYWDGYDPEVNPDVIASFAAAAYRFGHSLLPTAVERWSKAHKFIASKRLSDLIRRPYDLYRAGVLDEYVMGLMNQVAQAMDDSITQEVTNHLFKKVGARFGMDLVSFNMQRGREFGLPGYMEFRKFCGLPQAESFQDLFGSMSNQTIQKYETIFDHPIDVDLWSGGVSERPLSGSMLGPTFACIIATQFSYSRRGDRFWFELPNQPSSFTPEQLAEVRKARLARVICDNTDIIDTVQLYPMVLPDHELNPRVPCRSGIIPQIDFSKWAEPQPFQGSAKQFMTQAAVVENNGTKLEEIVKDEKDCNQTEIAEITPSPELLVLQAQNVNKTVEDITKNTTTDVTLKTEENQTKSNDITDKDTVMKYVYKKNDKIELNRKDKGHYKNSLKRRKRSTEDPLSPLPSKFQTPALIVNYETSHGPSSSANWSPPLHSAKLIKDTDLAGFEVQTRHENPNNKYNENEETPARKDFNKETNVSGESDESSEKKDYVQNDHKNDRSSESNEDVRLEGYKKREDYSARRQDSAENSEEYEKKDARDANNKHYSTNDVSNESAENYNNNKRPNLRDAQSAESDERDDYSSSEKPQNENDYIKKNERYGTKPYEPLERNINEEENHKRIPLSSQEDSRENNDEKYQHSIKPIQESDSESDKKAYYNDSQDSSNENSSENVNERYSDGSKSHKPLHTNNLGHSKPNYNKESQETSNENSSENVNEKYSDGSKSHEPHTNNLEHSKPNYDKESQETSNENSSENVDKKTILPKSYENLTRDLTNSVNSTSSIALQDIDLGDFSYERIKLNKNGKVEAANDNHDDVDPNLAVEIIAPNTEKPSTKNHDVLELVTNIHKPLQKYADKLININDGEVRPVVEIHAERDEESEEENSKENSNNSQSLETLLGTNESHDEENVQERNQNEKLIADKEEANGDVKQQFERIPTNYDHDQETHRKDVGTQTNKYPTQEEEKKITISIDEISKEKDIAATKPDGTIDVFTPDNVRYDDKLNIKFDDLQIKLPEIKLPDDILAYTKSYYNDEEDSNNKSKENYKEEDDDDNEHKNKKHYKDDYNNDNHYKNKKHKDIDNNDNNKNENDDDHHDKIPFYSYDNSKNTFGRYKSRKQKDDDHESVPVYYGYYGDDEEKSQDYTKKTAEEETDEEEDLYEKFVRERFGKRGTFAKRSQRLQEPPLNPELTKTLQNILKKTAMIDEQAKKSGDPNANYMWTLEYGENL